MGSTTLQDCTGASPCVPNLTAAELEQARRCSLIQASGERERVNELPIINVQVEDDGTVMVLAQFGKPDYSFTCHGQRVLP